MTIGDFNEIPILDLSYAENPEKKTELLANLRHVLFNVGFLYISNTGVPDVPYPCPDAYSLECRLRFEVNTAPIFRSTVYSERGALVPQFPALPRLQCPWFRDNRLQTRLARAIRILKRPTRRVYRSIILSTASRSEPMAFR